MLTLQLTNTHGINYSEIGGVHTNSTARPLLRVVAVVPVLNVAVFGPVQIRQPLKPRPPTLQIVIIQVRLRCYRLQGAQRPSQRPSAFVSVDLNGVVRGRGGVVVGFCDSSLNEVIHVDAVGCRAPAAGPDGILKLRFDVFAGQETVGAVGVLKNLRKDCALVTIMQKVHYCSIYIVN